MTVTADSLATLLTDTDNNYVTICDELCEFVDTDSSSTEIVCTVPRLSTTYSNTEFGIMTESSDLKSSLDADECTDVPSVFDDDLTVPYVADSNNCEINYWFKEDHVGLISQVRFFIPVATDSILDKMTDSLTFSGSDDGVTFTQLFVADQNIHEGWNYNDWDEGSYPSYRYY